MTTAEAIRLEEGIDSAVLAGNLEQAETWALLYLDAEPGGPPRGDLARSPWFRARYCAGKVALATGRLSQALDRLLPLLATVERISPDLAGRVRLLVAEALTRLRRGEEGRALLEEVPASLLVDDLPSRLRALCIRLWLGEVASLRQDLDDCLDALGKAGETANRVLLLTEEGRAWDAAGDL